MVALGKQVIASQAWLVVIMFQPDADKSCPDSSI
jgi:hypothetical protein